MLRKVLGCIGWGLIVIMLSWPMIGFSDDPPPSEPVTISLDVVIPKQSGIEVKIFRAVQDRTKYYGDPLRHVWDKDPVSSMNFGTLDFDAKNNIFGSGHYFAVEVGILSNAISWNIQHDVTTPFEEPGGDSLNENVNVTFVRQLDRDTYESIAGHSLESSDGVVIPSGDFRDWGGWLRIYYGLATGCTELGEYEGPDRDLDACAPDDLDNINAGVLPITTQKRAGVYKGEVKITMTGEAWE